MTEPSDKKRFPSWVWVAGVILLGLVLRLIYVVQVGGTPLVVPDELDPGFYFEWAQRIVAGDWIGTEPFVQSPLYAYFLAIIIATLGEGTVPINNPHAQPFESDEILGCEPEPGVGPHSGPQLTASSASLAEGASACS